MTCDGSRTNASSSTPPSAPLRRRSRCALRPGEWSVVENLRHLLYAEERHLLRVLTPGFTWTALGLPTRGIVKRNGAGSESSDDLEEVLAAWDATHQRVLAALREASAGSLSDRLAEGNLRHLRAHIRIIRRLLDESEG